MCVCVLMRVCGGGGSSVVSGKGVHVCVPCVHARARVCLYVVYAYV